jgi:hypothetical protein
MSFDENKFRTAQIASIYKVKSTFLDVDSTVVDMTSKTLNSLKHYLSSFYDYYQISPALQKALVTV